MLSYTMQNRRRNTGRFLRKMPGIQRFSPKRYMIQGANGYVSKKASPISSHQYYKRESPFHGSGRGFLVSKYYFVFLRFFLGITFAFLDRKSTRLNSSHVAISYA